VGGRGVSEDLSKVKFELEYSDPFVSPEGDKMRLTWEQLKEQSPDIANIFAGREHVLSVRIITEDPDCVEVRRIYDD
jgi:hypothetical protein